MSPPGLLDGAAGAAVILSLNPMHDTGGGQRSAQLALELLARDQAVLFVSHGEVTETVDLGLSYDQPRLVQRSLVEITTASNAALVRDFLAHPEALVLTQAAVKAWLPVLSAAGRTGAVRVYDLIDDWTSELGWGWYRERTERAVVARSDVLVATAPILQRRMAERTGRPVELLPNAYNARVFDADVTRPRPPDLPEGPVALYVGALWGSWMDWALVDAAARAHPNATLVFIGDHREEGATLPANCVFLGLKAQQDLPAYLAHATVGILPWKAVDLIRATSPLKVYEYLAMGLPVVAPALETLDGMPGVFAADGGESWIRRLGDALRAPPEPAEREAMRGFSHQHSWTRRVDLLLRLAADARGRERPNGLWSTLRSRLGL